jgi:ribosomal protein S18 acetylase RimI-like enzyme
MTNPVAMFDTHFMQRSLRLKIRPEDDGDTAFLKDLFAACSPLADMLPPALLDLQSATQSDSHRAAHPHAMRRIVLEAERPVGRIMVDWGADGVSHGVDIAVLPQARGSMAGLHMLRSWLDAADACGYDCTLEVLANNPAQKIYARLGFRAVESPDNAAVVRMKRPRRA